MQENNNNYNTKIVHKSDLPERTFEFAKRILKLCASLNQSNSVQRIISYQLLRAGTSIGANTEEGQAAQSEADFLTKYSIACKEARETMYWLKLLRETDAKYISTLGGLISECSELIAIFTSIVKKLKDKRDEK